MSLFQSHFTLSESAIRHVAVLDRQTVLAVGGCGKERTKMWSGRQSCRFSATNLDRAGVSRWGVRGRSNRSQRIPRCSRHCCATSTGSSNAFRPGKREGKGRAADTGALTPIHRFRSTANLNIRLHCLYLQSLMLRSTRTEIYPDTGGSRPGIRATNSSEFALRLEQIASLGITLREGLIVLFRCVFTHSWHFRDMQCSCLRTAPLSFF